MATAEKERINREIDRKMTALDALRKMRDKSEEMTLRIFELEREIDALTDSLYVEG